MKVAHWALLFFALQLSHLNAQTSAAPGDLPAMIVLVRHAEFDSGPPGNPPLSVAGRETVSGFSRRRRQHEIFGHHYQPAAAYP